MGASASVLYGRLQSSGCLKQLLNTYTPGMRALPSLPCGAGRGGVGAMQQAGQQQGQGQQASLDLPRVAKLLLVAGPCSALGFSPWLPRIVHPPN